MFACHKLDSSPRSSSTPNPPTMHNPISYNSPNGPNYPPPSGPSYYDSPASSYPPLYSQGYLTHQPLLPPPTTSLPPYWSHQNYPQPQPLSAQSQWATPSPSHPLSPLAHTSNPVPPSSSSVPHPRSASYSTTPAVVPPPSTSSWHISDYYRATSPAYSAYSTGTGRASSFVGNSISSTPSSLLTTTDPNAPPPTVDVVPPSKRRPSPLSTRGGGSAVIGDPRYQPGGVAGVLNAVSNTGGRGPGTRPVGLSDCSSCGATSSPEWRKGPSGKKELCNA